MDSRLARKLLARRSSPCVWVALALIAALAARPAPAQVESARTRIRQPVEATPLPITEIPERRPAPTKAPVLPSALEPQTSPAAVNIKPTASPGFLPPPQQYRTTLPSELRDEIARLRTVADKLTTESDERQNAEEMIRSLETRLAAGAAPEDVVAELTQQVSSIRKLPVKQPVRFELMDQKQLREYLEKKIAEELPAGYLPNYEFVLKLVGAIPQRADLRQTLLGLLSEQVAGIYDKDTKVLYVMKQYDLNRSVARIILSHEICHALQDQSFNISRLPLTTPDNDDLNAAVSASLEGDATLLMQEYARKEFSLKDVLQLVDLLAIDQSALSEAPAFLRKLLLFPYLDGSKFILQSLYTNPESRNRVFVEYPQSTEQILHPEKYVTTDFDPPTSFALPMIARWFGPGWDLVMTNVFGELQVNGFFENYRQWDTAKTVGQGWDGDRYALYRKGDRYAFVWVSVWDTDEDAAEFFDGFSRLMKDKRYKEWFASVDFSGANDVRTLRHAAQSAKDEVHLRFRKQGNAAIVEITNAGDIINALEMVDGALFDAAAGRKPAMPAPRERMTSPTAPATAPTTAPVARHESVETL
jgi:hypothetical protein